MTLTFDSRGITLQDPMATRFVGWDGLRGSRMVKPVVGMFQQFDLAWPDGRIGEWVRRFRPDVLAEAKAIWG